ncbi:MAG: 7-carboxy-7-deazaguanine synthase QueE [Syntrophotaleaceae bacterium]
MPVPVMPKIEGQLLEVFSSIQGEGVLVGCRQIFVRMALCNLSCRYCDTPVSAKESCRIEDAPGSGNFRDVGNPVSLEVLTAILADWTARSRGLHHSISLTGGEPLMQSEVLVSWLPVIKRILPVHLETNGTLPEALEPILTYLEWISMDIKLASQTGQETPWKIHEEFLRLARKTCCAVKAVVGENTPVAEIEQAAALMHRAAPETLLILQPVTESGRVGISAPVLLELQAAAAKIHPMVRVIPQTHHFIGLP